MRDSFSFPERCAEQSAVFGLLQKSVVEYAKLSQFVTYKNPMEYSSLEANFLSFVLAKAVFSAGSSSSAFNPTKNIQRFDVGQRMTRDIVDPLAL